MMLLDIILEPRRIDTARILKPIGNHPITAPSDTTDTVTSAVNVVGGDQQMADIAPLPSKFLGLSGDDFSMLLWSVVVVLVALSLCFYFIKKYRRTRN